MHPHLHTPDPSDTRVARVNAALDARRTSVVRPVIVTVNGRACAPLPELSARCAVGVLPHVSRTAWRTAAGFARAAARLPPRSPAARSDAVMLRALPSSADRVNPVEETRIASAQRGHIVRNTLRARVPSTKRAAPPFSDTAQRTEAAPSALPERKYAPTVTESPNGTGAADAGSHGSTPAEVPCGMEKNKAVGAAADAFVSTDGNMGPGGTTAHTTVGANSLLPSTVLVGQRLATRDRVMGAVESLNFMLTASTVASKPVLLIERVKSSV
jgi:hypothetical protein